MPSNIPYKLPPSAVRLLGTCNRTTTCVNQIRVIRYFKLLPRWYGTLLSAVSTDERVI